jgi:hypothetical protein
MVLQSPNRKELEKLNFKIVDGTVVDQTGEAISTKQFKAIKKTINWNLVGPGIAILIFVLSWVALVSERAYTATVNTEKIVQQSVIVEKQNTQIEELKKGNERQEILIKEQMQVLDKQDKIMEISREYHDKRSEAIERDVVGELRSLRLDIKDMKSELSALRNMLRNSMHAKNKQKALEPSVIGE